jgi:uncharacterized RDD family membrane protein YckC
MLDQLSRAPVWRRLLAGLYDTILLFAIWMLAIALLLPFFADANLEAHHLFLQAYLLITTGLFFTFFWVKGGQTLGMKAWRLQVCTPAGHAISWGQASGRFVLMLVSLWMVGAGIVWALFNREKLMWQDHFSGTRVRFIPRNSC